MTDSPQSQVGEVDERKSGPPGIELLGGHLAAPRRKHLDVDERGRRESLTPEARSRSITVIVVVCEGRRDDAGIDDDQRTSLSARTRAAASANGRRPPVRSPARSSTSSRLGVSASSVNRASRNSWRD